MKKTKTTQKKQSCGQDKANIPAWQKLNGKNGNQKKQSFKGYSSRKGSVAKKYWRQ